MGQADFREPPGPPRPEQFGLTEQRVKHFSRNQFPVSAKWIGYLGFYIGTISAVIWLISLPDSKGPPDATLRLGVGVLISISAGGVGWFLSKLLWALIAKTQIWLRTNRYKRERDYSNYLNFKGALSAYQTQIDLWEREQQDKLAADRKEHEEELRKQEAWWKQLSGNQFERELAELFRKQGFTVQGTGGSGDEGVDLVLKAGARTVIVQCKAHANYISPSIVRDLYGTLVHCKADEAWLVATSGFYSGARSFAKGKPIKLLTIQQLLRGNAPEGPGLKPGNAA